MEAYSGKYGNGGESDTTYLKSHKEKNKMELQVWFRKIKLPTFFGEKEKNVETWLFNMI